MSIAVQDERFIFTALKLRKRILPVITREFKSTGGVS